MHDRQSIYGETYGHFFKLHIFGVPYEAWFGDVGTDIITICKESLVLTDILYSSCHCWRAFKRSKSVWVRIREAGLSALSLREYRSECMARGDHVEGDR